MHLSLIAIIDTLESIGDLVLSSSTEDRSLMAAFGWNCPSLTRHDLSNISKNLAQRIKDANPEEIEPDLFKQIVGLNIQLDQLKTTTIAQMFVASNCPQASSAYLGTLTWAEKTLEPLLGWQNVKDTGLVPIKIAKRLRGLSASIDSLVPNHDILAEKVKLIEDAHETADALPTDMETLKAAMEQLKAIIAAAAESDIKIDNNLTESLRTYGRLIDLEKEAKAIVSQCGEAYTAATSHGLASAFDKRAKSLNISMWGWVIGLVIALSAGAWIGSTRIESLLKMLESGTIYSGMIWVQVGLSIMSVGAPLWLAWLATKQIGQRFRLSEDYAFKASVAAAYEGYRREAARIDEAFEAQLFASVLTRLDEAPLRLVEETAHGSPWHELISSSAFRDALSIVPDLRDKFIEVAKRAVSTESSAAKKIAEEVKVIEPMPAD